MHTFFDFWNLGAPHVAQEAGTFCAGLGETCLDSQPTMEVVDKPPIVNVGTPVETPVETPHQLMESEPTSAVSLKPESLTCHKLGYGEEKPTVPVPSQTLLKETPPVEYTDAQPRSLPPTPEMPHTPLSAPTDPDAQTAPAPTTPDLPDPSAPGTPEPKKSSGKSPGYWKLLCCN